MALKQALWYRSCRRNKSGGRLGWQAVNTSPHFCQEISWKSSNLPEWEPSGVKGIMGNSAIVIFVKPWVQHIQFLLGNFNVFQQRIELLIWVNNTDFVLWIVYIYLNGEKYKKMALKQALWYRSYRRNKSDGRFGRQLVNLPLEIPLHFCQQTWWKSSNLPEWEPSGIMGNSAMLIFVTPWVQHIQFLLGNFNLFQQRR